MRRATLLASLALAALALGACAKPPEGDPRYRPAQNVLEVVAVLRRHVNDDTYRFEPARDFTGRNVYRASLLRLESLQKLDEAELRAGHLDDVIAFAKGRALERLRAFDLAAASYRKAAEHEGELREEALRSAAICESLDEAARIGFDADRAVRGEDDPNRPPDAEAMLAGSNRRVALLEALAAEAKDTHYEVIVREEIERADEARASYFVASRRLTPDGDVHALSELQRLVARHRESKNANRHVLELADLYAALAEEYTASHPPESLLFDPPTFQELVDSASRLYQNVANQDGTSERIEASRRLEAFLAFTLRVDRDRFTP